MKVNIYKTKLPRDTAKFLKKLKTVDIENFNLALNKYIEFYKDTKSHKYDNKWDIDKFKPKGVKFNALYRFIKKQDYLIDRLVSQGYEIARYRFKPNGRVIVGLGSESVRDISMTLHWIYGMPYIPGQAIKGLLSNWMIAEGADSDEHFKLIFGDEENKGKVIFMDSYPNDSNFTIKPDIMNPHYSDYYTSDREPPSDWQATIPIHFFTLADVEFNICLIYLEKDMENIKVCGKTLEDWLREALKYGGVGAKTSLGYGTGNLRLIEGSR